MHISFIAFALIPYPHSVFNASANRCIKSIQQKVWSSGWPPTRE
jgi:hypothetical protein